MKLNGFTVQEGTVKVTKGDTIWLHNNGKDIPITSGSGAEHVQPGHYIRVLFSPKNQVVRIYNKNTGLVYMQGNGKTPKDEANRTAIQMGILFGLPLVGAILAFFALPRALVEYAFGDVPHGLRAKYIGVVLKTAIGYLVPVIIAVLFEQTFGKKDDVMMVSVFLLLVGPGYMIYRGFKKMFAIEAEYADSLTEMVRGE